MDIIRSTGGSVGMGPPPFTWTHGDRATAAGWKAPESSAHETQNTLLQLTGKGRPRLRRRRNGSKTGAAWVSPVFFGGRDGANGA